MDTIDKIRDALKHVVETKEKQDKAEKLYWLYRMVRDDPRELEVAFLLEANKLQKSALNDYESEV